MINFTQTSPTVAEADLDEVERRFGFKFPQAFRAHYRKQNGGHPDKNRIFRENGTFIVHDFLPIKTSAVPTLGTLERSLQWLKVEQSLVPDHLVQFAVDPFGNYYCFSTNPEDFGSIYWLRMEGTIREPEFVASSLDALLNSLRTKDDISRSH